MQEYRLAILQLLIVAKRCCVLAMKWLIAQAIQAVPKVRIAIEQRVKDNLTKGWLPTSSFQSASGQRSMQKLSPASTASYWLTTSCL